MTVSTDEVTGLLNDPFFTGTGAPDDEERWLPFALDGRGFNVDLSDSIGFYHRFQRTSVQLLNTQQANSGGDNAQIPPEVWRRSIESWVGGTGQKRFDRDTSLETRFFDSQGVDPFDPWNLSLLGRCENVQALGAGRALMTTVGVGNLFVAVGSDGYWFTDILGTPPTHMTLPAPIVDATSDGLALYTIDTTGHVRRYTDAVTSATFATVASTDTSRPLLRATKGFLVAAAGNKLWDISTGTPVLIYTHPLPTFWWRDAADGADFTYLVGGIGDRWAVYRMPVKSDGSSFDPPIQAAPIPDGEVGYSIGSYEGFITVGVSTGMRLGETDAAGALTIGRLLATDQPVRCFEGQDRFIWFGRSEAIGADRNAGLYRADLSTFTTVLAPAYATDLETVSDQGAVSQVTTYYAAGGSLASPKRVFTVDGVGLFIEKDDRVPSGWLDQGSLAFASSDSKMGLYAQVYTLPLVGSIGLDIAYDGGDWSEIGSATQGGSTSMGHAKIAHAFVQAKLRYRLIRDTNTLTAGPTITRAEIRVLPVSDTAAEWRLPIMVFETINYNGITQSRDVRADYELLLDLANTKRPFTMREWDNQVEVHATDYIWLAEKATQDGRFAQGVFLMLVREVG